MRRLVLITACLAASAAVAGPAAQQTIGSWVLACPRPGACQLRAEPRLLAKGSVTAELEVMARTHRLVPVVALRGVPRELLDAAALAGSANVTLRFPGTPPAALDCQVTSGAYLCAPNAVTAGAMADRLAEANAVTVVMSARLNGMDPFPEQSRTLHLARSAEALSRLRAAGAMPVPAPATTEALASPARLLSLADRLLRQAGYANGAADLRAWLDKANSR